MSNCHIFCILPLVPIAPAWECILEAVFGICVVLLIVLEYALPPGTDGNEENLSYSLVPITPAWAWISEVVFRV